MFAVLVFYITPMFFWCGWLDRKVTAGKCGPGAFMFLFATTILLGLGLLYLSVLIVTEVFH